MRFLVKDDLKMAQDCERFFRGVVNGQFQAITSNLVTAELAWTLPKVYKFTKPDVLKALSAINTLNGLKIVDTINLTVALSLYKNNNVKFVDCLLISAYTDDLKIAFVSYDKDFTKLGVTRVEPSYFFN